MKTDTSLLVVGGADEQVLKWSLQQNVEYVVSICSCSLGCHAIMNKSIV